MDNIAGSPVEGSNFYGRDAVVEHLRQVLDNDDILLLGPRRIGKTSAARAIMAAVRRDDWQAIEVNVARCVNEQDFLIKLKSELKPVLDTITSKTKGAIIDAFNATTKRIKSIKVGSIGVELNGSQSEDWPIVACDLLHLIAQTEQRWLIYVDELPIMLFNIIRNDPQNGVQRVRRFLDWFRNDVRALPGSGKVRWLVSGSVGLDTLVQEHGMADTINSMSHQGLEAFSDEVAVAMLGELAASYGMALSIDDRRKMVAAVQWPQPYYLQTAFNHLRVLRMANVKANLPDLIEQAINKMVQPGADNDFHHWEMRLSLQLSRPDADHALALLNLVAQDSTGARPENLLAALEERMPNATPDEARRTFIRLRDILQRDAYWGADGTTGTKRYRFRLEPLRRWWLRRNTL